MSIANTLRKAAKLQERIDHMRGQLAGILDKARAEIAASPTDEILTISRRVDRAKSVKTAVSKARANTSRGRQIAKKTTTVHHNGATLKSSRRSPLAGQKRASSPTGPLAPAVVKVLRSKGKPMNVRDILASLLSNGYKFNSPDPKKNLAARIYRLSGVKQVGPGMFHLA